jgi:regulator of sigma E protease
MSFLIFLVILIVLVLGHEFGHFFTAKRFGIRVDEFGFGFPPKLFRIKKGETEYSINALPFGGFVKIFGEDIEEANFVEVGFLDKEKTPQKVDLARSLISKPKWQQALVMFAGILANFLIAWLLLSFGFMSGLPTSVGSQPKNHELKDVRLVVVSVSEKSPAEIAGLKSGDKIISLTSEKELISFVNSDILKSFIVAHPDKEIEIGYLRGKDPNIYTAKLTPKKDVPNGKPLIGIAMDEVGTAKLPVFQAFWEGLKLNLYVTKATAVGLYTLIADSLKGQGSFSAVTGPIGMVGIVGDAYQFGWAYLLSFAALISINLAIINLIPFPALDGGRLLFLLIEKIKGSRINPKFTSTLNMIGFAILIILMLLVTYHDIVKLF